MQIKRHVLRFSVLVLVVGLMGGCVRLPAEVEPVRNFDPQRYLGTWYEIARLDHSFERGLTSVTAQYSERDDGGIAVLNRGYDQEQGEWSEAEGKAYFVESPDIGHLKVSFFGPFYSAYGIFELDEAYQYAWVAGHNRDYLWLLARSPQPDQAMVERFVETAKELGYDTGELIFVEHEMSATLEQ
ncbi:apolipoprotein D and lipocalin family protein [Halopseudomonas xinjiangensis]|uniref:Outer membrane lipoprotein Blc n=1 Tax=Halopseudomonas xinjiangensis TaxID=487184 RepID=A0A1H1R8P5_9GAMM|nr:lipocalin family protein [Halopseudomonas xinjiangensis]SDS32060.1 apolipoprotein D and lipocalin family protein [Halopseudomonas xinjiangensis]